MSRLKETTGITSVRRFVVFPCIEVTHPIARVANSMNGLPRAWKSNSHTNRFRHVLDVTPRKRKAISVIWSVQYILRGKLENRINQHSGEISQSKHLLIFQQLYVFRMVDLTLCTSSIGRRRRKILVAWTWRKIGVGNADTWWWCIGV